MWAAARLCQVSFKPVIKTAVPVLKTTLTVNSIDFANSVSAARHQAFRQFTNTKSEKIFHALRRSRLQKSNPEAAFTIGRGAVAGAGAVGLGALCYYGLGLSKKDGIVERAAFWPQYVKDRIATTYMYVGGSVIVALASAVATLSSPTLLRIFTSRSLVANLMLFGTFIGSSMIVQSIPYSPGFGAKQISWLAFASLLGGMMAPLSFFGGQVLIRAGWYVAGMVGGLSAVAISAPNDQFLKMGVPLAIGSGLLLASGLGAMFLPPTTAFGAGLHSFFMYGGLIFFSVMLMYNTQRIAREAESLPPDNYSVRTYDPINMSMSVFMDIVNIFMRMVFLVGGSNRKR